MQYNNELLAHLARTVLGNIVSHAVIEEVLSTHKWWLLPELDSSMQDLNLKRTKIEDMTGWRVAK